MLLHLEMVNSLGAKRVKHHLVDEFGRISFLPLNRLVLLRLIFFKLEYMCERNTCHVSVVRSFMVVRKHGGAFVIDTTVLQVELKLQVVFDFAVVLTFVVDFTEGSFGEVFAVKS